jgi:cytochrome b
MNKKLLSIRLFHWIYAFIFFIAFVSADDDTLWLHILSASMVFGLALFRLLMFTIKYQHWYIGSLNLSIVSLKNYMKDYFNFDGEKNPASSFMTIWLIILGIMTPISGYISDMGSLYAALHEVVGQLFMISVGLHIAGVVADGIFHKNKSYLSMIDRSLDINWKEGVVIVLMMSVVIGSLLVGMNIDISAYEDVDS